MKASINCVVITLATMFAGWGLAQTDTEAGQDKTLEATVKTSDTAEQASDGFSEATCRNGSLVRKVSVEVDDAAAKAPCRVVYDKETEAPGQKQTLYNAAADGDFCVTKASEFVAKLEGWGWECERKAL